MQLVKLNITDRDGRPLPGGAADMIFDVEDIVCPIRYDSNLSKSYFTARMLKDSPSGSRSTAKVDYYCSEDLITIVAKSPSFLRLSVVERRGEELDAPETQIFVSSRISESVTAVNGGIDSKFFYNEDGDPLPVEYVIRGNLDSIIAQQAANLPPSVVQIVELTWQEAQDMRDAGLLDPADGFTPGTFYKITDAAGTDDGLVIQAISETQLALSGHGTFLNPDFQDIGDYSDMALPKGVNHRVWYLGLEDVGDADFNHTAPTNTGNYTPGFYPGTDMIAVTGVAAGVVADVTVNGFGKVSSVVITNFGAGYAVGDSLRPDLVLASGESVSTITILPEAVDGDIVFWDGVHYQVVDSSQFDGTDPSVNTDAYTGHAKRILYGYIPEVDFVTYDFDNNVIMYRLDKRSNSIMNTLSGMGTDAIPSFQWGNDEVSGCVVNSGGGMVCINNRGDIRNNHAINDGYVEMDNTHEGSVVDCMFSNSIECYANFNSGAGAFDCVLNSRGLVMTFDNGVLYQGKRLEPGFSNFPATLDMSDAAVFAANVLTIPAELNYVGEFTLINNTGQTISSIADLPTTHTCRFQVENALTQIFEHTAIGVAVADNLVSDAALSNSIVGRTNGSDFIEYRKSGTINVRNNIAKLA